MPKSHQVHGQTCSSAISYEYNKILIREISEILASRHLSLLGPYEQAIIINESL